VEIRILRVVEYIKRNPRNERIILIEGYCFRKRAKSKIRKWIKFKIRNCLKWGGNKWSCCLNSKLKGKIYHSDLKFEEET